MSFNRLVQPECGAPNPLVAAAQNIIRPVNIQAKTLQPNNVLRTKPINLSQEFVQLNRQSLKEPFRQQMQPSSGNSTTLSIDHHLHQNLHHHHQQQQHHPHPNQHQSHLHHGLAYAGSSNMAGVRPGPSISAGDQLETKYRNDIISQMSSIELGQADQFEAASQSAAATAAANEAANSIDATGKLDDVEFWQSLSQQYMGPSTFNSIARLKAEQSQRQAAKRQQQSETIDQKAASSQSGQGDVEAQNTAGTTATANSLEERVDDNEMLSKGLSQSELEQLVQSWNLKDLEYTFDDRNPLKDQFEDPFEEGLRRLEQGDIPSAALLFEAAVQNQPDNALAWRYLGTTQAQNEMDKLAIRALSNCLRLDPGDQAARMAIAVSMVNEWRCDEACDHLLEWLGRNEKYQPTVRASLKEFQQIQAEGEQLRRLDYSQLASKQAYVRDKFIEAARMSPDSPDADVQNSLGVLFNMRSEYNKAVDCFKAALSVRQDDSLLWNRLGATLANGNKSEEAVIAYRRALEIAPGFLRSRYNLAISLIHFNLYDEAAKQLIQILNTQAAGKGNENESAMSTGVRSRSITSSSIWNTLRTVATLMNKPQLYPIIDGRDLAKCNDMFRTSLSQGTNSNGGDS